MKTLRLSLICLFFSSFIHAQELTGLWMGTLTNDSTKKEQRYELALSEYRGKVTGYSYTTFISNDTFYFSIKRMRATRQDSIWIVEDDEMVMHNFPEKPAKGVRQVNTFRLDKNDSTWRLDGNWKTTQTKKYYSLTGTMKMNVEENLAKSYLVGHLEELNLQNTMVFYQDKKATPEKPKKEIAKKDPPGNNAGSNNRKNETGVATIILIKPPETEQPKVDMAKEDKTNVGSAPITYEEKKPQSTTPVKTGTKTESDPVTQKGSAVTSTPAENQSSDYLSQGTTKLPANNIKAATRHSEEKKPIPQNVESVPAPVKKVETKQVAHSKVLPEAVAGRKNETIEQFFFKSDSLVLSLYDNGVVDGDTVTVFLNGENIMNQQKLKGVATKKTIYIPANADSMQLLLFADNLGSIPPNTGLLTIRDGENIYQVRFSADMQKNAAIILRRKEN